MPARGVIFDFDGVLVNSERTHLAAIRAAGATQCLPVTDERYFGEFVAYGDQDIFAGMARDAGRTLAPRELDALMAAKWRLFSDAAASGVVHFFPGARDLVRACASRVPVALCTAASSRTIDLMLAGTGLLEAFKAVVTADDVSRTKPDPEPYRKACELLGQPPRWCVAIEDTQGGAASAADAGCKVVAVCHTMARANHTRATHIVERIAELSVDQIMSLV